MQILILVIQENKLIGALTQARTFSSLHEIETTLNQRKEGKRTQQKHLLRNPHRKILLILASSS